MSMDTSEIRSRFAASLAARKPVKFPKPELPFGPNALEPYMSRKTLEGLLELHCHYVERANALIGATDLEEMPLDEMAERLAHRRTASAFSNNVAQMFNLTFFWRSLRPTGGGRPFGAIARRIDDDFGVMDDFEAKFREAALSISGSGWVWLVADVGKLKIVTTKDAKNPLGRALKPILALNMWEHAYCLDYGSSREAYVGAFLSSLANWDFANQNLARLNGMQAINRPASRRGAFEPDSLNA